MYKVVMLTKVSIPLKTINPLHKEILKQVTNDKASTSSA